MMCVPAVQSSHSRSPSILVDKRITFLFIIQFVHHPYMIKKNVETDFCPWTTSNSTTWCSLGLAPVAVAHGPVAVARATVQRCSNFPAVRGLMDRGNLKKNRENCSSLKGLNIDSGENCEIQRELAKLLVLVAHVREERGRGVLIRSHSFAFSIFSHLVISFWVLVV